MRFRFIHAADLHLDTPFVGLSGLEPELAALLRDASLSALERIVEMAIDVDAAFVILAGDIYDGAKRGIRAQLRLVRALERLSEAGIQTFVAHGNHDPERGQWSAIGAWPSGVTVFAPGTPTAVTVTRGDVPLATVHGVSYASQRETENLALRFDRVDPRAFHVGVLHCNVGDQPGHAPYSPCALSDLHERGHSYWALGHVHTRQTLSEAPWVVYPGNTQGRSFAPGERGAKGALVVEVDGGRVEGIRFFPTDSARFFEREVDIGALTHLDGLIERLQDEAERLGATNRGVHCITRARIVGRGPLHGALRAEEAQEEVLLSLRDAAPAELFWAAVQVQTRPEIDLDRLRAGHDFRAELLRTRDLWAEAAPADLRDRFAGRVADRPGATDIAELLDAAVVDLIDRLSPTEP